jgi:hypothetical protein
MLRIPHFLDNRFRDSGKVVSPTHPPHFTPEKHYYFYVSGTHFFIIIIIINVMINVYASLSIKFILRKSLVMKGASVNLSLCSR